MNKSEHPPVKLISLPKLNFSGIRLEDTKEEYDQIRRGVAAASSMKEHPECIRSWDMPYTLKEYERRLLAGEFD